MSTKSKTRPARERIASREEIEDTRARISAAMRPSLPPVPAEEDLPMSATTGLPSTIIPVPTWVIEERDEYGVHDGPAMELKGCELEWVQPIWSELDQQAYVELQHYHGKVNVRLAEPHARQILEAVQRALDIIDGHCES